MTNRGKKRALALVMTLSLLAGMLPTAAFAAGEGPLCDSHLEHTADCGYVEAVDGQPCGHSCDQCPTQDSGTAPVALDRSGAVDKVDEQRRNMI